MRNTTERTFNRNVNNGVWEVMSEMYSNYINSAYEVRHTGNNRRFIVVVAH